MFEDICGNKNTQELWDECRRKEEETIGIPESSSTGFFGRGMDTYDQPATEAASGFIDYYEDDFVVEDHFDKEKKEKMIELLKDWLDAIK